MTLAGAIELTGVASDRQRSFYWGRSVRFTGMIFGKPECKLSKPFRWIFISFYPSNKSRYAKLVGLELIGFIKKRQSLVISIFDMSLLLKLFYPSDASSFPETMSLP
jgi:hypothetical protein